MSAPPPPPPDLRGAVISRLTSDNELLADLTGGIWDRPLAKPPDRGATPEAFETRTGRSGALLPSAVVTVEGLASPVGAVGVRRTVTVWLYQQRPGREVIERAKFRVIELLNRQQFATAREGMPWLRFTADLGDGPVDQELNAEVDYVTFAAGSMIGR